MIKKIVFIILFTTVFKAESQNFGSLPYLDNGIFPYYIEKVFVDSVHDKLIVSSKYMKYANGKVVRGVCSWNGYVWDSLSSGLNTHDTMNFDPNGNLLGGITYNGKLLAGGYFNSIGGVNATSIALWNGSNWDSLPVRAFKFLDGNFSAMVYGFLKHNNKLYVHGEFDTIQGQKANGLATYDGISFQPILLPFANPAVITSMIVFNNEIYIAGNFYESGNPNVSDIYKFNGTSWTDVGGSIKGAFSSVGAMAVYNNQLYVGGYFNKASGNAGNLLMKWDGFNWNDAGWGSTLDNGAIWKLIVHHNKLFAFGTSEYASDLYASRAAVFDGNQWCAFKDTIENGIISAAVYHDTIYVAGAFKKIKSDTSKKYIAKLINESLVNNCNSVRLTEKELSDNQIIIYPNPVKKILNIEFNSFDTSNLKFELINSLWQTIQIVGDSQQKEYIDLSFLASGIYYLKVQNNLEQKVFKIIKE